MIFYYLFMKHIQYNNKINYLIQSNMSWWIPAICRLYQMHDYEVVVCVIYSAQENYVMLKLNEWDYNDSHVSVVFDHLQIYSQLIIVKWMSVCVAANHVT